MLLPWCLVNVMTRDTWHVTVVMLTLLCHVARDQPGSRETRGLSNIRGIIWCHHDQDSGGWLESEEDLTTISMSRGYIGDQEWSRSEEVFSTRHSNTQSSLQSIINTSKHAIVYTTSHGALNFGRNTVIELFKCPPVDQIGFPLMGGVRELLPGEPGPNNHHPGNSPNGDDSRVKITVRLFRIHTFPAPT